MVGHNAAPKIRATCTSLLPSSWNPPLRHPSPAAIATRLLQPHAGTPPRAQCRQQTAPSATAKCSQHSVQCSVQRAQASTCLVLGTLPPPPPPLPCLSSGLGVRVIVVYTMTRGSDGRWNTHKHIAYATTLAHPYPGIRQQHKAWVVRACSTPHLCFSPPPPWERTHAQWSFARAKCKPRGARDKPRRASHA
jgi:hypothetical protein